MQFCCPWRMYRECLRHRFSSASFHRHTRMVGNNGPCHQNNVLVSPITRPTKTSDMQKTYLEQRISRGGFEQNQHDDLLLYFWITRRGIRTWWLLFRYDVSWYGACSFCFYLLLSSLSSDAQKVLRYRFSFDSCLSCCCSIRKWKVFCVMRRWIAFYLGCNRLAST